MSVSAVIPTYNRAAEVARAIDSVLAQTVSVDEVIVVDDGSADDTAEVVRRRYGSRVAIYRQKNAGAGAARNRGIREARGEWIALLDSDDVWLPTKIERQLEALTALGPTFGLCFTDCVFDGDSAMTLSAFQLAELSEVTRLGALESPAEYILSGREPFYTPSVLLLRALVEEAGGFDETLIIRQDTDLFFRLTFKTKFCYVAERLVHADRSPSRVQGNCKLYLTRDDRKYTSLERLYTKWLAMPEVAGSEYEWCVREKLKLLYYSSAAAKIHDFRPGPAIREIGQLKALGESYPSVILKLMSRGIVRVLPSAWPGRRVSGERRTSGLNAAR